MKNKFGFTLAEILITIVVIGVVAAITLPQLIKNYQKKATLQKLHVTYSILKNGLELAKIDYGEDVSSWQGTKNDGKGFDLLYNNYFKPYIDTVDVKKGVICKHYNCKSKYKVLNGQNLYQHDWSGSFKLKNGALVHIMPFQCDLYSYTDRLIIDVNGPERGPNVLGKDTFDFALIIGRDSAWEKKHPLLIPPCENKSKSQMINACSANFNGKSCAALNAYSCCSSLIINDNWQMKEYYPW